MRAGARGGVRGRVDRHRTHPPRQAEIVCFSYAARAGRCRSLLSSPTNESISPSPSLNVAPASWHTQAVIQFAQGHQPMPADCVALVSRTRVSASTPCGSSGAAQRRCGDRPPHLSWHEPSIVRRPAPWRPGRRAPRRRAEDARRASRRSIMSMTGLDAGIPQEGKRQPRRGGTVRAPGAAPRQYPRWGKDSAPAAPHPHA